MSVNQTCLKVITFLPKDFVNPMMAKINTVMTPIYANYDYVFNFTEVWGTWRPLKGAKPYGGKIGEISTEREYRLEITILARDLDVVINKIKEFHPYEAPVIEYFPVSVILP